MPTLTRTPEENAAAASTAAADVAARTDTERYFPTTTPTKAPNWMAAQTKTTPPSNVTTIPNEKCLFETQQNGNFPTILAQWAESPPLACISVANANNAND